MIQGLLTAMITPFKDGRVDFDALARNVRFQIDNGVDGLVPVGTTGESPTLSHQEHEDVIKHVVETARAASPAGRKIWVVAGTGSNSTEEALSLTRHAQDVGVDAALMVNPYYNKPTQEGLYRHFKTVADAVDLPIVLYNIPGRTGVTMSPQTIARLAIHPNVVGVKEATGSLDMASEIATLCGPGEGSNGFTILSGDDSLTLPLMSIGAKGVISVLSNLIPREVAALVAATLEGDYARAREAHLRLFPLFKTMFIETNPIPIKTAMAICGSDSGELRLPLCEPSPEHRQQLSTILERFDLITH